MPHLKKRSGMVLTEALVAIATLAMGVIALGTITQNSISTTILARDYLVARGLAKEGEEVVKNIRLTNRMLKPGDSSCWLNKDVSYFSCPDNVIANDYYVVAKNNNGTWILKDLGSTLPDPNVPASWTTYQLFTDSNGYYSYYNKPLGSTPGSKFYRSIQPTNITIDPATSIQASVTFNILVQWKDGAKTQKINRSITLYNYL